MGSISIDLTDAVNENDMAKCNHFSIRGYVAEAFENDMTQCWPFSKKSYRLMEQGIYPLPPLSVPNDRRHDCTSCIRDILAGRPKDPELRSYPRNRSRKSVPRRSSPGPSNRNALAVVAGNAVEQNENQNPERSQQATAEENEIVICARRSSPSPSKLNALAVVAGNAVEEDANVNSGRSQQYDLTTVEENENVICARSSSPSSSKMNALAVVAGNAVEEDEKDDHTNVEETPNVNCEKQQKDDRTRTASTSLKRVRPSHTVRNKSKKLEIREPAGNERSKAKANKAPKDVSRRKDKQIMVEEAVSSEIAGVAEDTPPAATKKRKGDNVPSESIDPDMSEPQPKKARKSRLMSDLVGGAKRKASAGRKPVRGRKGKMLPQASRKLSCGSESTESGSERDPIKGKQRNKKFQVVDVSDTDHGDSSFLSVPCPPSKKRTKRKQIVAKRNSNKVVADKAKSTGTDEGTLVKPRTGPSTNAISQPTLDLSNEVDDRLAENDHGSSSKSNTGEVRTGLDLVDLNSNNTEAADRSCVLQKDDASVAKRKGKGIMVEEHQEAPRSQSQDTDESTEEEIEIAQLILALDKEEVVVIKEPTQETTPPKPLLIDLNETYVENGVLVVEDDDDNSCTPSQPEPVESNVRQEEEPFQIGNTPPDFFAYHAPSPAGNLPPPPPTQEYRASSSYGYGYGPTRLSGHNSQWPYPSPFQAFGGFDARQSAPHQYQEAAALLVWRSSMIPPHDHHHRPFSYNMDQSTNHHGMFSQASSSSRNPWSLNSVASNGMQKCGSHYPEYSFGYNHGAAGFNGGRSVDPFNQNSMPTLPLYSRIDPRLGLDIPTDRQVNANFTKRHFPPPVNQHQQRMDLQRGDSSKKPYFGNRLETSRSVFQQPSSLSFQAKRNDTTAPSVFPTITEDGRFLPPGASNSTRLPVKSQVVGEREKKLTGKSIVLSDVDAAMRNSAGKIVCTVNKNPADFTTVEPGNGYMLTGEHLAPSEELLEPKSPTYKRRRASSSKQEALKQSKKPAGPSTDNTSERRDLSRGRGTERETRREE